MELQEAREILHRGCIVYYRGYSYDVASIKTTGVAAPYARLIPLGGGPRVDGLISYKLLTFGRNEQGR